MDHNMINTDININKIKGLSTITMTTSDSGFQSLNNFLNYKTILKKESNFLAKNKKRLQDIENSGNNCKKVKYEVDQNSITSNRLLQLKNETKPKFGGDFLSIIAKGEEKEEIDLVSLNNSSFIFDPSCFLKLPSESQFTELPYLINSPSTSIQNLIQVRYEMQKPNLLFDSQKKMCLNNLSLSKETSEQTIEAKPLIACITANGLSTGMDSKYSNKELDSDKRISNAFLKDLDIVDPDILYNVQLLKHLSKMKPIAQKISKLPFDQTLLKECMLLSPMPEKKHGPKMLTRKKIENFTKDISEYKYDIGSDDWNKIMAKHTAIFTAHAELLTASEESLYVLVDVAIDFIKNVASTMRKKFDIEKNNSCPDSIDQVNKSLVQIDVKGSLSELVKNNDNYIFKRRDILLEKCQNLQQIINKYTDQHLTAQNTRAQSYINDYFVQENPASETFMVNEEITWDENESDDSEESILSDTS